MLLQSRCNDENNFVGTSQLVCFTLNVVNPNGLGPDGLSPDGISSEDLSSFVLDDGVTSNELRLINQ